MTQIIMNNPTESSFKIQFTPTPSALRAGTGEHMLTATSSPIRVLLFGFGDFAYHVATLIHNHGDEIVGFITTERRLADEWQADPRILFSSHDIWYDFWYSMQDRIPQADILISASYRAVIPMSFTKRFPLGAWNIHGSLLPALRGHCPVNWAVINGLDETGFTIHQLNSKIDAGPIGYQATVPIHSDSTAHSVWLSLLDAINYHFVAFWPLLRAGTLPATPQDEAKATSAPRRTSADGLIDWYATNTYIDRMVRALAPPFPGAFAYVHGRPIRIFSGRPISRGGDFDSIPGTNIGNLEILCGYGAYKILTWEPATIPVN